MTASHSIAVQERRTGTPDTTVYVLGITRSPEIGSDTACNSLCYVAATSNVRKLYLGEKISGVALPAALLLMREERDSAIYMPHQFEHKLRQMTQFTA